MSAAPALPGRQHDQPLTAASNRQHVDRCAGRMALVFCLARHRTEALCLGCCCAPRNTPASEGLSSQDSGRSGVGVPVPSARPEGLRRDREAGLDTGRDRPQTRGKCLYSLPTGRGHAWLAILNPGACTWEHSASHCPSVRDSPTSGSLRAVCLLISARHGATATAAIIDRYRFPCHIAPRV